MGRFPGRRRESGTPDRASAVFAALAHAERREILRFLRTRRSAAAAGAIAERFSCSWPTTSRHLAVLLDAGLVRVRRRGRERLYTLDRGTLVRVAGGWIAGFRKGP